MAFTFYRLQLDDPLIWNEQVGDPITNTGGAAVPAVRSALRHEASITTFAPITSDSVAGRLKIRRQYRSLANNTPMKLTGVFLAWEADAEQNGWYAPDQGQMVAGEGSSGIATGWFKLENFVWFVLGKSRTHRRAVWVFMKDLRTGLSARDYRRTQFSTDFSGLTALQLSYLGPGLSAVSSAITGAVIPTFPLPAGEDGGIPVYAVGLLDELRASFEQPEASRNLAQVVAYDRRGEFTRPSGGPGTEWEEFYGPDYPYAWLRPAGEATAIDTPVLDNGQCRVTYDSTNTPGWRVEVWTGSKWEEQCKVTIFRYAETQGHDNELLAASLIEYNETRGIVKAVMRNSLDPTSQEEVFITLERGWSGPRFEVYPALNAAGEKTDAYIEVTLAVVDTDDSAVKIDSGNAGAIQATAQGTGHTGEWTGVAIGALTFTGENEVIVGRWKGSTEAAPYGLVLAVVQAAARATVEDTGTAYGAARNTVRITGAAAKLGYVSAHLGFPEQHAQQALEAENMTLGTGSTVTTDAAASNGKAVTATRTTDANAHVTQAKWPNSDYATYRVFARVKTSASTLNIYAKTSGTTGATKTTASTSYVWLDLGDIVANESTLEIHCWATAAATVSVDRIEAFMTEDRVTAHGGYYRGGRDLGQAVLMDSRTIPTIVTRGS